MSSFPERDTVGPIAESASLSRDVKKSPQGKTKRPQIHTKNWGDLMACATSDLDPTFFSDPDDNPKSTRVLQAKAVCNDCPVQEMCLYQGFVVDEQNGTDRPALWGGLTPTERDSSPASLKISIRKSIVEDLQKEAPSSGLSDAHIAQIQQLSSLPPGEIAQRLGISVSKINAVLSPLLDTPEHTPLHEAFENDEPLVSLPPLSRNQLILDLTEKESVGEEPERLSQLSLFKAVATGATYQELAKKFRVSTSTVRRYVQKQAPDAIGYLSTGFSAEIIDPDTILQDVDVSRFDDLFAHEARLIATLITPRDTKSSSPQLAKELFLAKTTVDTYFRTIFAKVGVKNKIQLAAIALAIRQKEAKEPTEHATPTVSDAPILTETKKTEDTDQKPLARIPRNSISPVSSPLVAEKKPERPTAPVIKNKDQTQEPQIIFNRFRTLREKGLLNEQPPRSVDEAYHPVMTPEQEAIVFGKFRNGEDMYALMKDPAFLKTLTYLPDTDKPKWGRVLSLAETIPELITISNHRFVIKKALLFRNTVLGHKVKTEELVQAGTEGLLRAIEKFDPEKGYRFVTYATPWLRYVFQKETQRQLGITSTTFTAINRALEVTHAFQEVHKRKPTPEEVADLLLYYKPTKDTFSFAAIDRAITFLYTPKEFSTNKKMSDDEARSKELGETISQNVIEVTEAIHAREEKELVHNAIDKLTPREKRIVTAFFNMNDEGSRSLRELAEEEGLQEQDVTTILATAFSTLRSSNELQREKKQRVGALPLAQTIAAQSKSAEPTPTAKADPVFWVSLEEQVARRRKEAKEEKAYLSIAQAQLQKREETHTEKNAAVVQWLQERKAQQTDNREFRGKKHFAFSTILTELAQGATHDQIARKLDIAAATVRKHIYKRKTGLITLIREGISSGSIDSSLVLEGVDVSRIGLLQADEVAVIDALIAPPSTFGISKWMNLQLSWTPNKIEKNILSSIHRLKLNNRVQLASVFIALEQQETEKEKANEKKLETLMTAIGNHEGKALLLGVMEEGQIYSRHDKKTHPFFSHQSTPDEPLFNKGDVFSWYEQSLLPAGLVEKVIIDAEKNISGYRLTTYGATIGKAAAGNLLSLSEKYPYSQQQMFGAKNAPLTRARIFRMLLTEQPLLLHELETALDTRYGKRHTTLLRHLDQLARVGIITHEKQRNNPPLQIFTVAGNSPSHEPRPAKRMKKLLGEMLAIIDTMQEESDVFEIERNSIYARLIQKHPEYQDRSERATKTSIADTLKALTEQGYLKKEAPKKITLTKQQEIFLTEVVSVIDEIKTENQAFIASGLQKAKKIIANPQRVSLLLEKARTSSFGVGRENREKTIAALLEIIEDNPNCTARDLQKKLAEQGKHITTHQISHLLQPGNEITGLIVTKIKNKHHYEPETYTVNPWMDAEKRRAAIREMRQTNTKMTKKQFAEMFGLPEGIISWDLRKLVKEGAIPKKKQMGIDPELRQEILTRMQRGDRTQKQIAEDLGITRSRVDRYVKVLVAEGLLTQRSTGPLPQSEDIFVVTDVAS